MMPIRISASRKEPNTCPESMGTRCDGCPYFACINEPKKRLHRWHYYCDLRKEPMEQKDLYEVTVEMCPIDRPLPARRFR